MFENILKKVYQKIWVEGEIDDWVNYIGQVSWLLFLRYLDSLDSEKKDQASLEGKEYKPILEEKYRWSSWAVPKNALGGIDYNLARTDDDLIGFVNNELFPYLINIGQNAKSDTIQYTISEIFKKLENKFENGFVLRDALDEIDYLEFNTSEQRDELGHIYENMLQNLNNKGSGKGEYYTPRPLIRAMVDVVDPQIGETIYDGACGTCGFLYESFNKMKSKEGISVDELEILKKDTFYGQELKAYGFLFGVMNMILHGFDSPNIIRTDTLSKNISTINDDDRHDIIVMNPPFGSGVPERLQMNFQYKSSEMGYLFLQHIIKKLKAGGRAGIVIKNTFLSNGDAENVRRLLLEKCNVHTIMNMPKGTFLGAGISTIVLFFEKGHPTKQIWYYDLDPGRNLGKTNPLNDNDLAEFIELQKTKPESEKSWMVNMADVNADTYDLSVKNPNTPKETPLRSPQEILTEMETLDSETKDILGSIKELI